MDESPFFWKHALSKAAKYTLNRVHGLKAFLFDDRIEIDNNPAENAIRPNVIGRKNWLFSVSEAGEYLVKLMRDLPNLLIHQQPDILNDYIPWSKSIQATCAK